MKDPIHEQLVAIEVLQLGMLTRKIESATRAMELDMRPRKAREQEVHITEQYIWRTRDDDKVRPEHRANHGKIFSWDTPPPTGHPGESFGCRCWAEPYAKKLKEKVSQVVTSAVNDAVKQWTREDFISHYLVGKGEDVSLSGIGHLKNVIHYAREYTQSESGTIFERVERQVFEKAREYGQGVFIYSFENSYDLTSVAWEVGRAAVRGSARVSVRQREEFLIISAVVDYVFFDRFTDPVDRYNIIPGNFDFIGVPYDINGSWKTRIEAIIRKM